MWLCDQVTKVRVDGSLRRSRWRLVVVRASCVAGVAVTGGRVAAARGVGVVVGGAHTSAVAVAAVLVLCGGDACGGQGRVGRRRAG